MSMAALKHSIFGNTPWSRQLKRISSPLFAALTAVIVPSLSAQSYVPPIVTTASTTLFSNGSTSMGPGRVAVDKAGNVFYIDHVSPYTLYEIPAASPAVTITTPVPLITGLGQYNANAAFVDSIGNLWVANGNAGNMLEIPASGGIPNTAALAAGGEAASTVAATSCTATSTMPCGWASGNYASNVTGGYSQPSDVQVVTISGTTYVYFVDVYDNTSKGKYNRVQSFSLSNPNTTGVVIADELSYNADAEIAVDGLGNVFYVDSPSGGGAGGVYAFGKSTGLNGGGTASAGAVSGITSYLVGTSPTLTTAAIASATSITVDQYNNLYISSSTQISEVPFEGTAQNFADEFGVAGGLSTNNVIYGGAVDINGNFYYASYTNIQQVQIDGYNFGSVPVGSLVNASSTVKAPTLTLYFNTSGLSIASYFPTGSPTSNTNAPLLQSFPWSGTKSFNGSTSISPGVTGTIVMDFMPVHPGLLKGSFTPRSNGANDAVINLQGVGIGSQPLFFPGTPSQLFTAAGAASLNAPGGLAVDTYGDIFVADSGNHKVVADCLSTTTASVDGNGSTANGFCANTTPTSYVGTITQLGTGFTTPSAIALDGGNNLYVTDSAANTVTEISGVSLTSASLVSAIATFGGASLSGPRGIAVDGYTNVYIADTGNNRIVLAHQFGAIPVSGAIATDNVVYIPSTTTFGGTALSGPTGLAVDSAGDLFIADTGNNRIVEYTPLGVASVVSSGSFTLSAPTGITVYPSGALVVTDAANGVSLLNGASSQVLSFGSTYTTTGAKGVALDLVGNIYLSNTTGDQVLELNVTSPQTLTFPSTTEGQTSASTTTQVFNSGNSSLVLSALSTSNGNYTIDPSSTCNSTSTVTAGNSCNLLTDFTPQVTATPGTLTGSLTLTDNQDSYTLTSNGSNEIGVFASTGTQALNLTGTTVAGTPQTITFPALTTPVVTNVGPITLSATASSGLPVTFSVTSGPGSISGNTLTVTGAGTVVVAASQSGNSTYAPATTVSQSIVVNYPGTPQTISFAALPSPVTYGVAPMTLSATASSGLAVTFAVTSGLGTISGNTLTITGAGTVVVTASQPGNSTYAPATASQSIVVNPLSQTITFAAPTSPVLTTVGPIMLSAAASSGLPVTFSVTSGPGTISGNTLTITGAGTIVVAASQPGNSIYGPATAVSQSIVANAVSQTITFPALTSPINYGVTPIALSATASSGLAVTFSVTSGPATISGNTLAITGAGTVVVAANQAGNTAYAVATTVSQSVVVNQAPQTITFAAPTSPVTYGVAPISLSATASSGLAVTFAITSGPATISGSTLTITNAGTVVVAASQAGNTNYTAAPTVAQSIVVNVVGTVVTPTFTPAAGTYAAGQTVTLADTTPGAAIHYTTDGTTPTTSSTLYKGAITVSATETIQAIAVATGYINSSAASAIYTIAPQNFSVGVTPGSLTIPDGQSGTVTISVTPSYGYAGAVSFACSGLPAGATCSFSPSPIIASGTTALTTTLTVSTTSATAALRRNSSPLFPGATLAAALCFLSFRKRRPLQTLLLVMLGVFGLSMVNGCGSNSSPSSISTPTGTSTVTVTVSGGTLIKTTTFTLTVQ